MKYIIATLIILSAQLSHGQDKNREELLKQLEYYQTIFYEVEFWEEPETLFALQHKIAKLRYEIEQTMPELCGRTLN